MLANMVLVLAIEVLDCRRDVRGCEIPQRAERSAEDVVADVEQQGEILFAPVPLL